MNRTTLACFFALIFLALSVPALAASEHEPSDCYLTAPDGTCLDDPSTIPGTGQFGSPGGAGNKETPTTDRGELETPEDIGTKQHHANVVLKEDTFVYAHDICRWVGNASTRGMSFFIGLETKPEWVSFIKQPPVGAQLELCCKPVTVNRCGQPVTLPFTKGGGQRGPFTAGYDSRSTFRCVAGANGLGATAGGASAGLQDSGWVETTTGSCDAPDGGDGDGDGNPDQGNDHDGGGDGGESRDGNGDGHGDGGTSGDPAKGNDGQCGGGKC